MKMEAGMKVAGNKVRRMGKGSLMEVILLMKGFGFMVKNKEFIF